MSETKTPPQSAQKAPQSPEPIDRRGKLLFLSTKVTQVLQQLQEIVVRLQDSTDARHTAMQLIALSNEYQEAAEWIEKMADIAKVSAYDVLALERFQNEIKEIPVNVYTKPSGPDFPS